MKKIFNTFVLVLLIVGCSTKQEKKLVSDKGDYASYLESKSTDLTLLNEQVSLWTQKINKEPRGFTFYEKLGSSYHQLFEKTGQVAYLHKADSAFAIAQKLTRGKWKVLSLLSLSSLSIKRHDFESAASYAVSARELTDEKFGPLLMQFDAEMELGNYQMAKAILKENRRMDSFDYLVRLAKFKDYEGDLDSAIYYMEQASELVSDRQKERKLWAIANLGDMYGHAGRIEDSYKNYLKVLSIDPTYDYALKGIAWVAYSNDEMTEEAKEILKGLQQKTAMPDNYLLLAEISEYEGDVATAKSYTDLFFVEAAKEEYEGMYNTYLIDIFIERENYDKALTLAEEEVSKRPTPATYDWLAWVLFKKGETDKSIGVYEQYVEGKTYEPDAIYHMGIVYHMSGEKKGEYYLEESLEAAYELGPVAEKNIRDILKV